MAEYGVTSQGFARKPLAVILAEIEEANIAAFGTGVIQTPESPLGQLNGAMASIAATMWEIAQETYDSYDPDQAEGTRLDTLATLRVLGRMSGESDAAFRQAITNTGRARFDLADMERAALDVTGATWARGYTNASSSTDANGIPAHSNCLAVIGGLDSDVAAAIQPYLPPGIGIYGNTAVNVTVSGRCRTINIMRPTERAVWIAITCKVSVDANGCPAPSTSAIAVALANALSGDNRPANGDDVTLHMLRTAIATVYPNVEITAANAAFASTGLSAVPLSVGFNEMASIVAANISVTVI